MIAIIKKVIVIAIIIAEIAEAPHLVNFLLILAYITINKNNVVKFVDDHGGVSITSIFL